PGDGLADPGFLVVGQLRGPDGEVVGPGRLHDGPGETGTGDGRPGPFWVHWGAGRVLHQPPAGELHTEVEPAGHDAGEGEHDGDRGDGQPAAPVPHQVRVPRGKPAADPAEIRYPADLRTAPYRPPVHHPLRQHPGDDQGADQGGEHAEGQRDT